MIFFDIDGTLFSHNNSEYFGIKELYGELDAFSSYGEDSLYKLWRQIADKHFDRYLKGELSFLQQRVERVKELFATFGYILSDKEAEDKYVKHIQKFEKLWGAFDDTIPCLKKLEEYRLGIISNGDCRQQLSKLEKIGIREYFEVIIISGDVGFAKPDVRIFEVACERASVSPKECYYIGDDLNNDVLPCKDMGINGIWLNRRKSNENISNINMIFSLDELKQYL